MADRLRCPASRESVALKLVPAGEPRGLAAGETPTESWSLLHTSAGAFDSAMSIQHGHGQIRLFLLGASEARLPDVSRRICADRRRDGLGTLPEVSLPGTRPNRRMCPAGAPGGGLR